MRSLGCVRSCAEARVCGRSTHDVVDAVWLQGCRVKQLFRGRLSYNGRFLAIGPGVVGY